VSTGDASPYSPLGLLQALAEHDVEYIVIGGVAAAVQGSPSVTFDLDVCYARTLENLTALATMLRNVQATLRGAPPDLPLRLDAEMLARGDHFTFSTTVGDFGCLGTPAGTAGYDDLLPGAIVVQLGELTVKVTGLDDLIRMKRAAGRPKDRVELEILGALREEHDRD
jgi:hypothetical protein